ncbi:MAG: 30S ribosomal protein S6 [Planctomycetota bacterium]|nr:30S ribosomal protein S6 [Planctomycetota bacterium]
MSDQRINTYEGLFLFPQSAAGDLQGALDHLKQILAKAEVEIISLSKWDERRLAYEIKGNKRGIYFLTFFKADASKIQGIERDCNLSEQLLRIMITRADNIPQEMIDAAEGQEKLSDEIRLRAESDTGTDTGESSRIESRSAAEAAEAAATEAAKPAAEPAKEDAKEDAKKDAPEAEAEKPVETKAPAEA